jgi:hypothetical protein
LARPAAILFHPFRAQPAHHEAAQVANGFAWESPSSRHGHPQEARRGADQEPQAGRPHGARTAKAKAPAPKPKSNLKRAHTIPFASRVAQAQRNAASPSAGADPHHADLSRGGIQAEKDHQDPSLLAQHDGARASKVQVENYGQFKNKKVGRLDVVSNWYRKGKGR